MAQIEEPFTNSFKDEYQRLISSNTLILSEDIKLSKEVIYLKSLKSTLDLLLLEKAKDLDLYEDDFDHHTNHLDDSPDSDPNKLFLLAELRLKYALALFKYGHELEAAWNFRLAHKHIQRNLKLFPDFTANYKTSGAINIILGSIPEKHQWLLTLVGLKGSIENGKNQLDKLINSNSIFRHEAIMIKSLLQAYVLNQTQLAIESFEELIKLRGPLIQLQKMVLYLKNSNGAKALNTFEAPHQYDLLIYVYYLAGDAYIQKADYQKAEQQYSKFLKLHQGSSNRKDAMYKIWLCHYLSGDQDHVNYRDSAKLEIESNSETDKYAGKILSNNEMPNKEIMKLRLATDGGFYHLADSIISKQPSLQSVKDTVEYDYRLARLYHKKGYLASCIDLYKSVLNYNNQENWYFAPNSALMLGYIYQEKNELELSRLYLRKAMSFKHHEYKNSIDTKAEAALNTISDR
ncbi:tetratricopeptide repeat protein [Fulvivirga lutimaris]|uniref:tetratricopeptide repeat protein n=1 Tax=Fulvivirga lutimaris TaxID=1819566 RepID=UPI0012BC39B3|nr:hypothetical protein [Fulvivirga lutimaris]MTI40512.1 hypothetical protein [Fulvivirga lutimaris]